MDERRKGRDGDREGWEDGGITDEWKDGWTDRCVDDDARMDGRRGKQTDDNKRMGG